MSKNALLIIAHGSRKASSNDEVVTVVSKLKEHLGDSFDRICVAFLELATPSIEDGIRECLLGGATHIVIVPYFLALGKHVSIDIPEVIKQQQLLYPNVTFKFTAHLGSQEGIVTLLSDMAVEGLE